MILDDIYNLIVGIISTLEAVILWIITGIINVFTFIYMIGSMMFTVVSLLTGFFSALYSSNMYVAAIITAIIGCMSLIVFLRIWNILSDISLWGFKLPKL